jgi:hypothetical protein
LKLYKVTMETIDILKNPSSMETKHMS